MTTSIPAEQLWAHFDALIRTMPSQRALHHNTPENHQWLGEAAALVHMADPIRGAIFKMEIERLYGLTFNPAETVQKIIVTLQQFRTEYRIKGSGPLTIAFNSGQQFDYFDEVRKIIETATADVFVVDPYLGADFIGRYLPHVKPNVSIRLLIENQITQVQPAAILFSQQHSRAVEVRKSKNMHDRYIFIDGRECFHSGATFKDGASKSATTLTQITDAFDAVKNIYETAWSNGTS